jgi:hypothetical protein
VSAGAPHRTAPCVVCWDLSPPTQTRMTWEFFQALSELLRRRSWLQQQWDRCQQTWHHYCCCYSPYRQPPLPPQPQRGRPDPGLSPAQRRRRRRGRCHQRLPGEVRARRRLSQDGAAAACRVCTLQLADHAHQHVGMGTWARLVPIASFRCIRLQSRCDGGGAVP